MTDLSPLFAGTLTEEETGELLASAASDMDAYLAEQPQALENVNAILDRHLRNGVDINTWRVVGDSMTAYLGDEHSQLVAWLLSGDQANGLKQLEKYASPKVIAFLRMIVGVYGQDLAKAYFISDQIPHDWSYIYRNVYYDAITERHLLRVRVEKNNGEEVLIEGDPNSFLHMTELLMRSLVTLGTAEVFRPDRISQFTDIAIPLLNMLLPEEEEEEGEPGAGDGKPSDESG